MRYYTAICPKHADRMANSVNPDHEHFWISGIRAVRALLNIRHESSLIWVYTICPDLSVQQIRIITVLTVQDLKRCLTKLGKWHTQINGRLLFQNEWFGWNLFKGAFQQMLKKIFQPKWNKNLFYLTVCGGYASDGYQHTSLHVCGRHMGHQEQSENVGQQGITSIFTFTLFQPIPGRFDP